jgi:hypothetical protein
MSAADYNGDGLLDVYLCTYRPAPPAGSGTGAVTPPPPKKAISIGPMSSSRWSKQENSGDV